MTRYREKVRDLVNVGAYRGLTRFDQDPALTIENYHFSDATAALMARWLDLLARTRENGLALALAGIRGVGKSHFIATVAAVAANPEFRSKLSDAHVLSSAQGLHRRHYPLVSVFRGSGETFESEFYRAVARTFSVEPETSVIEAMRQIRTASGDLPVVIAIDTAHEREARVQRNDGEIIAQVADVGKELGMFVIAALDDDIAAADGSNVAIARSFNIEYLDQEHLYSIIARHVFLKDPRMSGVIEGLYQEFRENVPEFRWSEHRFRALYPVHPVVPEVAPFIRYYCPDFTLLGFAAAAGERILGRPADSLIGLEEVFDAVEPSLRTLEDLQDPLASFDRLDEYFQRTLPAADRYRSKLLLKSLLIFALSGRGATAAELAASTLISNGDDPAEGKHFIDLTLAAAAAEEPMAISAEAPSPDEPVKFRLGVADEFTRELEESAHMRPESCVLDVITEMARRRFPDFSIDLACLDAAKTAMPCTITWRGSVRTGLVFADRSQVDNASAEWLVRIDLGALQVSENASSNDEFVWQFAELGQNDLRTIKKFAALRDDGGLRARYPENTASAINAYNNAVQSIAERVMLTDARLRIDGFDFNLSQDARAASSIADVFAIMLEPVFETRYPEHPYFRRMLNDENVDRYIASVFGGKTDHERSQLIADIGEPLEIGTAPDSPALPTDGRYAKALVEMLSSSATGEILLTDAESALASAPFGLDRNAQRLLFCSLVHSGFAELVTLDDARIAGRSLDLKLDWPLITRLAYPRARVFSIERISKWAGLVASDPNIASLGDDEYRARLMDALRRLDEPWARHRPVDAFNAIPDVHLNNAVWKHGQRVIERLAPVMDTVSAAVSGSVALEECLEEIAEAFSDSAEAFSAGIFSMKAVMAHTSQMEFRRFVREYLAACGPIVDSEIEPLTRACENLLVQTEKEFSDETNRQFGYAWERFVNSYRRFYVERHETFTASMSEQTDTLASSAFVEFAFRLGDLPALSPLARDIRRIHSTGRTKCTFDVERALAEQPLCHCGFHPVYDERKFDRTVLGKNIGKKILQSLQPLAREGGRLSELLDRLGQVDDVLQLDKAFLESLLAELAEPRGLIPRGALRDHDSIPVA